MCAAVTDTYALAARSGVRVGGALAAPGAHESERARRQDVRTVRQRRWCARKIALHARECVPAGAALPQRASRVLAARLLAICLRLEAERSSKQAL
jgi:hypothetical protein